MIDEINRSPAKTQAALFEAMEEYQVTVDGTSYALERPFIVLATENPIDLEGTYRLPEAQIDRFLFKIEIQYPAEEEERQIMLRSHQRGGKPEIDSIKPVVSAKDLIGFQKTVLGVHIEESMIGYISQIVQQTRNNNQLFLGASPRASLSIMRGAKAFAAMSGRDFVTQDDIKHVTYPALRHRLILAPETEMEGISADSVITEILKNIEVPR